jgi:hypothetical protein
MEWKTDSHEETEQAEVEALRAIAEQLEEANNKKTEKTVPLELVGRAYTALLQMDKDFKLRISKQCLLCDLRDCIANITGKSSEEVQNTFEELALKEKMSREGL